MNRLTRRLAVVIGGAALGVVAMAGTASAHTEAAATAASAGRTKITFSSEAECGDGKLPTSGLRVQLPQGATDVQPSGEGGWTTQVTATEVAWSSANPAPGDATFVVEMVLAQPVGSTVYLPAIQACPDGTEIAWIQIPTTPGETLQNPAPEIEVPANEVVVGDLAIVATGEPFPADGVVVAGTELTVDESALTGEAYPVSKHPIHGEPAGDDDVLLVARLVVLGDLDLALGVVRDRGGALAHGKVLAT